MTVAETIDRFAVAEQKADADALETLLAEDFHGVGPLGFVLTKEQWIGRYRSGALVPTAFELRELSVRELGDTALVLGVSRQEGSYNGHQANGEFRMTLVLSKAGAGWQVAHCHLSGPLGPPPGRPPSAG
ncbi:nuclear transport factor 2 family protein [Actinophytocola sediminis]